MKFKNYQIMNSKFAASAKLDTVKLCLIIYCCLQFSFYCSQTFPYESTWGTYYDPSGSDYNFVSSQGRFLIDNKNNLHIRGSVITNTNLGSAYYKQYVTSLGQNINMSVPSVILSSKFFENGNLLSADFWDGTGPINIKDILIHSDINGNSHYLKYSPNILSDATTQNV